MAAAGTGAVASAPTPPQRAGGARPSDLCSTPRVRAGEIEHLQPARRRLSPLPSLFPRPLTGGAGAYLSSGSTRSSAACGATRVHAAICHRQSILLITASLCRHIRPRGSPPLHHLIKIHAGLPESSWPCRPVGPNRHLAKPSSSPEFHKPHRPPSTLAMAHDGRWAFRKSSLNRSLPCVSSRCPSAQSRPHIN